jgi:hypothetical protein
MSDFPWDNNDLEKLLYNYPHDSDLTAKEIMSKNRFDKTGRRKATAIDVRYLMLMAVKNKKARITKGFLVEENTYTIRLVSKDYSFIDPLITDDFLGLLSTFNPESGTFSLLSKKDSLVVIFPEIGKWEKEHDVIWNRRYTYWQQLKNAL